MRRLFQLPVLLFALSLTIASLAADAQTNFGSVAVGSSAASSVTVTIPSAVTLGFISVLTQGAAGLDFTNSGTGSCSSGTSYHAGQACTVEVAFKPQYPGGRYGVVLLKDGSGNLIATSYLYGIGLGPQIAYGPGIAIAIDSAVNGFGLNQPSGVAVDGAGNLYIADDLNKRVVQVAAVGGAATAKDPVVNGQGLNYPRGVAVDAAGDVFISDLGLDRVVEMPAGGGTAIAIDPIINGHGLSYPCGMVVDAAGDLFIADVDNARVVEVPAGGGAPTAIDPMVNGKGLSYPVTLALDSAGDLFIADLFANQVVEVPAGGGAAIAIAPTVNGKTLDQPYGVAVDAAGNLFIADAGNSRLLEVPASGGPATVLNTTVNGVGLSGPVNIALDNAGDLFIADSGNNRVVEVQRSQPPTLSFAATSVGSISSDSPQTVEVENVGNAPLTFPVPSAGNNPAISANFTLNNGGTSACPLVTSSSSQAATLAAGAACQLSISFQPVTGGSVSGSLTLTDNSLNAAAPGYATQSISLFGDTPLVTLSAASLAFGPQAVGTASATRQVTITNSGGAALAISSINVTGENASSFVFTNPCASSLAAGANCVIQGHFTPVAAGAMMAAITITDAAWGSPQTVTLTGTGVEPVIVTVTPGASSITTAQPLNVAVAVSGGGGGPTPTGSVTLTIGGYVSAAVALINGSASISVPAGSLNIGTDSIVANYIPDNSSASTYDSGSGSSSVSVAAASTATAPTTSTGVASAITANAATLAGTVNPNGADTHTWFLYGTSSTLSGASQTAVVDVGSVAGGDAVTANVSGLNVGTVYYYQAVAQNNVGTSSGSISSFTTAGQPYLTMTGTPVTISPGATSGNTSTITLTPWFGFTGNVTLAATITSSPQGAASLPTFSFGSAGPVSINGTSPVTATLTISTQAGSTGCNATNSKPREFPWHAPGGAVLACVLLCFSRARRRRWASLFAIAALFFALAGGVLACGSGSSSGGSVCAPITAVPTTAGAYTINVTGTSGSSQATGLVSLTVQ